MDLNIKAYVFHYSITLINFRLCFLPDPFKSLTYLKEDSNYLTIYSSLNELK